MALSLKDPETDRLARERCGRGRRPDLVQRRNEIARHCASLPDLDPRSPDEIIGCDERGVPR